MPSQQVQLYQGDWQRARRPAELIYVAERCMPQILYIYGREDETAEPIIIIKVFVKRKILSVETILSA